MSRITTSIAGVIALAFVPVVAQAQSAVQYESRTYGDYGNTTLNPAVTTDAGFASVEQEAEAIRRYQGQFTPTQNYVQPQPAHTYQQPAAPAMQYEYPLAKTYSSREDALSDIQVEMFDTPIPAVNSNAYSANTSYSSHDSYSYSANTLVPAYQPPAYQYDQGATSQASTTTYIVQSGDTVYAIGRRYGLAASDIMNANGMSGSNIQPGQMLTIPSATETYVQALPAQTYGVTTASTEVIRTVNPLPSNMHAVLPGDTLFSLARRYCTSAYAIASASRINSHSVLSLGQQLTLPADHCTP